MMNKWEEAMEPLFRIVERQEAMIMRLIDLLNYKGILTEDEYNKYLSSEALDELMERINERLKEEEDEI